MRHNRYDEQERILCAAVWYFEFTCEDEHLLRIRGVQPYNVDRGIVICGWRHGNCIMVTKALTGYRTVTYAKDAAGDHEQGFLTSKNRFVDRQEAMKIAFECGQVPEDIVYYKHAEPFCRGLELEVKPTYNPLFSEDLY